jgi:hypothetical protein
MTTAFMTIATRTRKTFCVCAVLALGFTALTNLLRANPLLIDFSHCGYAGANRPVPASADIPARIELAPGGGGDDTGAIQQAIDSVGKRAAGSDGFRGAVLLRAGVFKVAGTLGMRASGVVLRGDGATLLATGIERRAVIRAEGGARQPAGPAVSIDGTVSIPVGATTLRLAGADNFSAGDRVIVRRPGTQDWIRALAMDKAPKGFADRFNWSPGTRDFFWDRIIVSVDRANRCITLDAPLTMPLEKRFGGATVQKYEHPARLRRIGIEDLAIVSEYDTANPKDEEHAWFGIMLDNVEDAWVRRVTTRHLASAGVIIGGDARAVTVEDCRVGAPVAEEGGWRRLGIWNNGQLVLVQRCVVARSWHGLATGHCAAGPNVYLDCEATDALADATPFESCPAGTLYDNVRVQGAGLRFASLVLRPSHGAGWNAASSVIWNCEAGDIQVSDMPFSPNKNVSDKKIQSLYREQLRKRVPAPRVAQADAPGLGLAAETGPAAHAAPATFEISGGHFLVNGRPVFGPTATTPWWKGDMLPNSKHPAVVSPTLWVPGRPGAAASPGEIAHHFADTGAVIYNHMPGLWYDRRREAHELVNRDNPDVYAPFYEMPWARSGKGVAADGLSRYDLSKFNPWYWSRLSEMARHCSAQGVYIMHHFYNVHNLLETAAHWVDFPWRPGNCIQELDMPDSDADGRVHVAKDFFDITHPVRRELHRLYIRKGLDVLDGHSNVIHTIAFQYAGPVEFQHFFLDVVAGWERETGHRTRIALITGKEQTDGILADPARAAQIDVIDLSYWRYLSDGTLFAPPAGRNRAFREFCRDAFPDGVIPQTTAEQVYRQVREYRDRFPGKVIMSSTANLGPVPVLMAGGSGLAATGLLGKNQAAPGHKKNADTQLFQFVRDTFAKHLPEAMPRDDVADAWCLATDGGACLFYSPAGDAVRLKKPGVFKSATPCVWFDTKKGRAQSAALDCDGDTIKKPDSGAWLLFIPQTQPANPRT